MLCRDGSLTLHMVSRPMTPPSILLSAFSRPSGDMVVLRVMFKGVAQGGKDALARDPMSWHPEP